MGLYKTFKTDKELENNGIFLDYGDFRITVARSGANNKKYQKCMERKLAPYKRALAAGVLPEEKTEAIVKEAFAETVVLNWETKVDGVFKQGIEGVDGDLLPFTKENLLLTFYEIPDIFTEILEQSAKAELFKQTLLEEDSKN